MIRYSIKISVPGEPLARKYDFVGEGATKEEARKDAIQKAKLLKLSEEYIYHDAPIIYE